MTPFVRLLLFAAALALAGCVTKREADAKARQAYAEGERSGMLRMQQQALGPNVTLVGDVSNGTIPWTEDLTLAKAIVAAGYNGKTDPTDIVIVRGGRGIRVDPKKLLAGEDVPLMNHDIVSIRR
jgi:hypothetical protein